MGTKLHKVQVFTNGSWLTSPKRHQAKCFRSTEAQTGADTGLKARTIWILWKFSLLINTWMPNLLVAMKPLHSSAGGKGSVSWPELHEGELILVFLCSQSLWLVLQLHPRTFSQRVSLRGSTKDAVIIPPPGPWPALSSGVCRTQHMPQTFLWAPPPTQVQSRKKPLGILAS